MDAFTHAATASAANLLAAGGLQLGGITIPWSVLIVLVVVIVGLMLIKTAFTLVKVAILVGICIVIFLGVQFLFKNFT